MLHKATRPSFNLSLSVAGVSVYEIPSLQAPICRKEYASCIYPRRETIDVDNKLWYQIGHGGK
jgi:hypothetical protein